MSDILTIATKARVAVSIIEDDLDDAIGGKRAAAASCRKQLGNLWEAIDALAGAIESGAPAAIAPAMESGPETEPAPEITTPPPGLQRIREIMRGVPCRPRQVVAAPTKRPVGGRVNPCAVHREETHPAAIARREGRPNKRRQNLGGGGGYPGVAAIHGGGAARRLAGRSGRHPAGDRSDRRRAESRRSRDELVAQSLACPAARDGTQAMDHHPSLT